MMAAPAHFRIAPVHGFWRHAEVFDAAEPLTLQIATFLRSHRG